MLRKQIDANLAHHKHSECPLTKKDILDLGQLQKEIEFQENIHGVRARDPAMNYQLLLRHNGFLPTFCQHKGEMLGRDEAERMDGKKLVLYLHLLYLH